MDTNSLQPEGDSPAHPFYTVTARTFPPYPAGRETIHPGTHSRAGAERYAAYRRYDARGCLDTQVEVRDCRCPDGSPEVAA